MSTNQTPDSRTPNGVSDLLDDGSDSNASVATPEPTIPAAAAPPTPSTPVYTDGMFTKVEKSAHEQEEGYSSLVQTSIQAVSQIVDNIVQQKKAGNADVNTLASREIDKYFDKEDNEGKSLISNAQELDTIHGEGEVPKEGEKAPYQDPKYGEQPPMSLPSSPTPYEEPPQTLKVSEGQLMTSRRRREKKARPTEEETGPPPNPFKEAMKRYEPNNTQTKSKSTTYSTQTKKSAESAFSFTNLPKPGAAGGYRDDPDYDNVAMELGMTPESHPEFFRKKKYKLPVRILYNKYCQYCMIISGFVMLSLSVAALVTRGFEEVKKHNSQVHSKESTVASTNNGQKEKLDWWLDEGGNGMSKEQFEALTYALEDSYLPIWFDRKSGWKGQTYQEAVQFCANHDDFMPCPYDVYCPGKTGKLIEGTLDNGISWAPFRDETDGWVQVGAGAKECEVFLGGEENAQFKNYEFDEEMTKHVMCCLKAPLGNDVNSMPIPSAEDAAENFSPNLDLPDPPVSDTNNSLLDSDDVDKWYLEQINQKYDPRWYDRQSKWNGHTYQDALSFCYSMNKKVPCPYSIYCPKGPTGNLIFDVHFEEVEAWAATGDRSNQYVMVGSTDQCNRVTTSKPAGYGRSNVNDDIMSHLMCCNDVMVEVSEDLGVAPTVPSLAHQSISNSDSGNTQQSGSSHTLTELEHNVKSKYIPFWFGFKDGWTGGSYQNALDFCASVDSGQGDSFHLCPLMAYCPNGPQFDKPLFLQKEAYEGEQWAPTSFAPNAWIQIGQISKDDAKTCTMYKENYHKEPDWGLDGSEPGLKQHILCCKGGSHGYDYTDDDQTAVAQSSDKNEAAALTDNEPEESMSSNQSAQGSIQGMPQNIYGTAHNGAGNSYPHGGTSTHEEAIVVHLNPVWYDHSQGWTGGSHSDAEEFCTLQGGDQPLTLCPYDAYCPQGPTNAAFGGSEMEFLSQEQYAPFSGDNTHWVLIGRFNNAMSTTCLDYNQLFGETPSWGADDSRKELKQHILCCMTSDAIQSASVVGIQANPSLSISATTTTAPVELTNIEVTQGTWFGVSDGWEGGSRIDAIKFCYNKGEDADGIPLMLCPYEAYCPNGPSQSISSGNTYIGINESFEQWAPTLSKPNHWVLVGSRGDNDATTCLDTWQLDGDDDPSWGKDSSNADHKHHVMCCSLN